MAPKTISLIAVLSVALSLSATSTVSLAQTQCQRFSTLGKALEYYDFPVALFPNPNDVQSFSCNPVSVAGVKDAISLVVRLKGGACIMKMSRQGQLENFHRFEQKFSAIISYRQLTNVKGFTLGVILHPIGPLKVAFKVDQVKIVKQFFSWCLQFNGINDYTGSTSPHVLPISLLPSKPPSCDSKKTTSAIFAAAFDHFYEDNAVVAQDDDIHHIIPHSIMAA